MYYKTAAEVAAVPDCSPVADTCGPAQTTGSTEYPTGAAACTSGVQTDIDINGFDNTYNWKCGALSCSATVLPYCEVIATVVWVTDIYELSVGATSASYTISTTLPTKFNAGCVAHG